MMWTLLKYKFYAHYDYIFWVFVNKNNSLMWFTKLMFYRYKSQTLRECARKIIIWICAWLGTFTTRIKTRIKLNRHTLFSLLDEEIIRRHISCTFSTLSRRLFIYIYRDFVFAFCARVRKNLCRTIIVLLWKREI